MRRGARVAATRRMSAEFGRQRDRQIDAAKVRAERAASSAAGEADDRVDVGAALDDDRVVAAAGDRDVRLRETRAESSRSPAWRGSGRRRGPVRDSKIRLTAPRLRLRGELVVVGVGGEDLARAVRRDRWPARRRRRDARATAAGRSAPSAAAAASSRSPGRRASADVSRAAARPCAPARAPGATSRRRSSLRGGGL